MHRAVSPQWNIEDAPVGVPVAINEQRHVGTQMALVVKHVAAQAWMLQEGVCQRGTQGARVAENVGRIDETPQLGSEGDARHGWMLLAPAAGRIGANLVR
jgi:hypothetical protein